MDYRSLLVSVVACCAVAVGAFAETARDIIQRYEMQKLTALAEYLKANPNAADRSEAEDVLITGLVQAKRPAEAIPYLLRRYEAAVAETNQEVAAIFTETVRPLLELYSMAGQREQGRVFVNRARRDLAGRDATGRISLMLDRLKGLLDTPQLGDVLDIKFTSTDNRTVDLAALKGKVVLVDFWASWCGPCVREMPHVVSAYEKFHAKGFEIIGISLDESQEAMQSFVRAKGMKWPQYFDGKGWDNELARRYGVLRIPTNYLVGRDGRIIAMDLKGEQLMAKLTELFETP